MYIIFSLNVQRWKTKNCWRNQLRNTWGSNAEQLASNADKHLGFQLRSPSGELIPQKRSVIYLGGLLSVDGRADAELSRRLGLVHSDFRKLAKLWSHGSVPRKRSLQLLHSFVFSKLLYGPATMWMVKAQLRRIDGFQARCLRKVLGVPAAFVSRISNAEVLRRAAAKPLSQQLQYRQLVIMGKVARASPGSPLRQDTFIDDTLIPQELRSIQKQGLGMFGTCTLRIEMCVEFMWVIVVTVWTMFAK